MSIYDLAHEQRRALAQRERAVFAVLRDAAGRLHDAALALLRPVIDGLLSALEYVKRLGVPLDGYFVEAATTIAGYVSELAAQAPIDAARLLRARPADALAVVRAAAGDATTRPDPRPGRILSSLRDARRGVVRGVRDAVRSGRASRLVPPAFARLALQPLEALATRAASIARTEALRTYREAARDVFEANADRVFGWVWQSALDRGTCAFCWSMHGTQHPTDEPLASHVNCRCQQVPILAGQDLPRSGVDRFADLDGDEQRGILGPSKFQAYSRGLIDLEDVRGFRTIRGVGRAGFERSLRSMVGPEWAAVFRGAAREPAA